MLERQHRNDQISLPVIIGGTNVEGQPVLTHTELHIIWATFKAMGMEFIAMLKIGHGDGTLMFRFNRTLAPALVIERDVGDIFLLGHGL